MDRLHMIDPDSTVEETTRRLERRCDEIKTILARRSEHLDMIDWSAMTETDRDWAQHHLPDDIRLELWEIDSHLDTLNRCARPGWGD